MEFAVGWKRVSQYVDSPIIDIAEAMSVLLAKYNIDIGKYSETTSQSLKTTHNILSWMTSDYPLLFLAHANPDVMQDIGRDNCFYAYVKLLNLHKNRRIGLRDLRDGSLRFRPDITLSDYQESVSFAELFTREFGKQYDNGLSVVILTKDLSLEFAKELLRLAYAPPPDSF